MKGRIIVIGGPTATGKTAHSVAVAKAIGGEIVSADSMQIYRGMDVGTAKVTSAEMQGVPHHMIDVVEPWQTFSVAEYKRIATEIVDDIISRDKTPILVGGTGLYVNAVLYPMQFRDYDPAIRAKISEMYREKGNQAMHDLLRSYDPETAERLSPNDVKRVTRALELCFDGTRHSQDDLAKEPLYDYRMYVLTGDRAELYERINMRVDKMIAEGLEQEVRGLIAAGVSPTAQSFQAIAYKEFSEYLSGNMGYNETVELIKKRSRNYAKRQLTWFRQYSNAVWLQYNDIENNVKRICDELHAE